MKGMVQASCETGMAEGVATQGRYRIQQQVVTDLAANVLVRNLENLVQDIDIKCFLSLLRRRARLICNLVCPIQLAFCSQGVRRNKLTSRQRSPVRLFRHRFAADNVIPWHQILHHSCPVPRC
jgi:hypothetical protein